MKIVLKNRNNEVLYESTEVCYLDAQLDEYDVSRIKTMTGNMTMNDITSLSLFRLLGAPDTKNEEVNNGEP